MNKNDTQSFRELLDSSIKSRDTEEKVDLAIFRPLGLTIALAAKKLHITPNTITIISVFAGVIAGHLFYYEDFWLNILGVVCLSLGSTLDSADGQLARMTGQCTQFGRILDGIAGYLWFASIYLHLLLRFYPETGIVLPILFGFSICSHAFQSGIADYYRSAHLAIVAGKGKLDSSDNIKNGSERKSFFGRLFNTLYLGYTELQENCTKNFQSLKRFLRANPEIAKSEELRSDYRNFSRPLQKFCNAMTLNSRFFAIYAAIFTNCIWVYVAYEIVILNIEVVYTIKHHEKGCAGLLAKYAL